MATDTIPSRLREQATTRGNSPAYYVKSGSVWKSSTWAEYAEQVWTAAKAMVALGLEAGDRVCILGFNRPEWTIFDIAAMTAGASPAGIYTTCSSPEVQYIIDHAEAPLVLLEDKGQWEKVKAQRDNLPHLKHVVMMKGTERIDDPLVMSWEEFNAHAEGVPDDEIQKRLDAIEPHGLATMIYTSGTTGPPKGVMLSHENLTWTTDCASDLIELLPEDCSLSYLPLSHIAEQVFSIHAPLSRGMSIYFAESIDKVRENLAEVQPTVLFAVPRIWEKFHAGISGKLLEATGLKKKLVEWAQDVGREVSAHKNSSKPITGALGLKYKLADRLVFSKLKARIGLGRARVCVSGAAPIAPEVLEFFAGFDLVIHEVYGQSEDTGPTSFNAPGATRYGTVGQPMPGVQVKIAQDDEILVKGPNVFLGYFKNPEATAETLQDGWLHSGDLGKLDSQNFLSITGRKKDIIITAGGKNIAPKNIEAALKNLPMISEAVVIGDRRKFLSALVTLDEEYAAQWASERDLSGDLHTSQDVIDEVQKGVDNEVNPQFARVETIKKFTILHRQLTVDDGELTPTLKVKRKVVHEHFADEIEAMYT